MCRRDSSGGILLGNLWERLGGRNSLEGLGWVASRGNWLHRLNWKLSRRNGVKRLCWKDLSG